MEKTIFDEYVRQIIQRSKDDYAQELVSDLLSEFQLKAAQDGRAELIDSMRQTLSACDHRQTK